MRGYFEKKYEHILSIPSILFYLALAFVLTILANFVRLLTLIVFHILPQNPLHDLVGLWCLICYVLLPIYFLVNLGTKRQAKHRLSVLELKAAPLKNNVILAMSYAFLLALHAYNGLPLLSPKLEAIQKVEGIDHPMLAEEITPNGVLELQNEEVLIYLKPPVPFFQGSHDPRFCWRGSGYQLQNINITRVGGKEMYTAVLSKEEDQLYTAWWYENDAHQTPYEWTWRWNSLRQQKEYYLINITSTNQEWLHKWILKSGELFNASH
ncbi:MAG: exosortase N [Bacteroidota bacterium]